MRPQEYEDRREIRKAMRNMPAGKPTSIELELDIWEQIKLGIPQKQIAIDAGVAQSTVSKIKHKYMLAERGEAERMQKEKVVAGDKKNGQLVKITDQQDTYRGTCRRRNGKFDSKRFHASSQSLAEKMWGAWCEGLRKEDAPEPEPFSREFDAQIEPRPEVEANPQPVVEPVEIVGTLDTRELADLSECFTDDPVVTCNKLTLACEPDVELVTMDAKKLLAFVRTLQERLFRPVVEGDPSPAVDNVYVTYLVGKGPHAFFDDEDEALRAADLLNSAMEFAGVAQRYEVDDVPRWSGR